MNHKALVVIDIQNDITRHYRDIMDKLNAAIEWAAESGMEIVYIQHNNLSAGTRTFKPGTKEQNCAGAEDRLGSCFRQDEGQRFDQRGVFGIHPVKEYQGVLHNRSRCHCLREIHLFQHDKGWICRSYHFGLCDQL